jgi:hypothetical protein
MKLASLFFFTRCHLTLLLISRVPSSFRITDGLPQLTIEEFANLIEKLNCWDLDFLKITVPTVAIISRL